MDKTRVTNARDRGRGHWTVPSVSPPDSGAQTAHVQKSKFLQRCVAATAYPDLNVPAMVHQQCEAQVVVVLGVGVGPVAVAAVFAGEHGVRVLAVVAGLTAIVQRRPTHKHAGDVRQWQRLERWNAARRLWKAGSGRRSATQSQQTEGAHEAAPNEHGAHSQRNIMTGIRQ